MDRWVEEHPHRGRGSGEEVWRGGTARGAKFVMALNEKFKKIRLAILFEVRKSVIY